MLRGIEVMLVDLQDAGARYYTFLWTAVGILRSAQRNHIPVILLDRPNPIGGLVQGNVLDTAYRSAVGYAAIPMRHGMTLGELALLAQHDFGLTARLTVVPAAGWRRSMYFDATALPWIPPSPNLRTIESLIHYPGLCLFEGSTLSVGRGSDHPFEQVGAPWLDSAAVLAWLRRHPVPGVEFSSVVFTPTAPGDGKFADTTVTGIRLRVTDRAVYDPVLAAVAMFAALQDSPTLAGSSAPVFPVDTRHLLRLYGAPLSQLALQLRLLEEDSALMQVDRVTQWREQRADFLRRRRPFLLYPE